MIAFIGGTSLVDSTIFRSWPQKKVKTPHGVVTLQKEHNSIFLQRHGNPPLPPHRINHKANIWAMKHLGVQEIVAINSVGSLKLTMKPGTFLIPNDFLAIWHIPTFFDNKMQFMVPCMNSDYTERLYRRCKAIKIPVKNGGIYVQTQGPRLETKAEVNMLKKFGDIVGMTMASEVTLCLEVGISYGSICSIDNYCHGIVKSPLTIEEIRENVRNNLQHIERLIESMHRESPR